MIARKLLFALLIAVASGAAAQSFPAKPIHVIVPYAAGGAMDLTTRSLAAQVGPAGAAVGVDCAEKFIARAQGDAQAHGIGNASFFVADVQTADLRGHYDRAFSRFGTMFFDDPAAAFANLHRAAPSPARRARHQEPRAPPQTAGRRGRRQC